MMNDVIVTRTARLWLGDDSIMRAMINPGAEETLDTAMENVAAVRNLSHGILRPLIVDMSSELS